MTEFLVFLYQCHRIEFMTVFCVIFCTSTIEMCSCSYISCVSCLKLVQLNCAHASLTSCVFIPVPQNCVNASAFLCVYHYISVPQNCVYTIAFFKKQCLKTVLMPLHFLAFIVFVYRFKRTYLYRWISYVCIVPQNCVHISAFLVFV